DIGSSLQNLEQKLYLVDMTTVTNEVDPCTVAAHSSADEGQDKLHLKAASQPWVDIVEIRFDQDYVGSNVGQLMIFFLVALQIALEDIYLAALVLAVQEVVRIVDAAQIVAEEKMRFLPNIPIVRL